MRKTCINDGCKNLTKPNGYKKDGSRKYYKYCSKCLKIRYNETLKYTLKQRVKVYNITEEDYANILKAQNNKCAICEVEFTKTPHIDHCHTTGKIRGLLCSKCNHGIGLLGDTKEGIEKALKYLS